MDKTAGIGNTHEISRRVRVATSAGNLDIQPGRSIREQESFQSATWPLLLRVASAVIDESPVNPSALPIDATAWATFASDAETHGLAPLAHACLQSHRDVVPEETMQQLEALALRHRIWHRERTIALAEILQAFGRASIDALVLKGAALAWSIYASPELRPMGDIDLMVAGAAAPDAQQSLRQLGFDADDSVQRRFGRNAHHLPIASRSQSGVTISVEIHRDALSRDTLAFISMSNLTESARPFDMSRMPARTLGHIDTLRHLTHHLLEPSWNGRLRLVGLVDLFLYALRFHEEIDWPRLEASYPFVLNALRCLHHVVPLPAPLARFRPAASSSPPAHVGETIRPLRAILASGSPTAAVGELFNPPDWWLHAYYGVPPDRALTAVRFGRHPWRVARWLGLRVSGF